MLPGASAHITADGRSKEIGLGRGVPGDDKGTVLEQRKEYEKQG